MATSYDRLHAYVNAMVGAMGVPQWRWESERILNLAYAPRGRAASIARQLRKRYPKLVLDDHLIVFPSK
jgi:hypothetical protein